MKTKILFIILLYSLSFSDTSNRVAYIHYLEGKCKIVNAKDKSRSFLGNFGNSILNNDIIIVEEKSKCHILFDDSNTKVDLNSNSKIRINNSKYGREIVLDYGSLVIENSKSKIKTYVSTEGNEIYINNNKVWIKVDDKNYSVNIFATNQTVDIYNSKLKSNISIPPLTKTQINKDGKIYKNIEVDFFDNDSSLQLLLKNINNEDYAIYLNNGDLIPEYTNLNMIESIKHVFNIDYQFGTRVFGNNTFVKAGVYPRYRKENLFIGANLELFLNSEGELYDNWNDVISLIEKIQLSYKYHSNSSDLFLTGGIIEPITFGHGYLVKDLSNSFNYPNQNNFGLNLSYVLEKDFMKFKFFFPSIRDFSNEGGLIGMHTSLYISHNFPLTLGLGIVADFNQFSSSDQIYNFSNQSYDDIDRNITAVELDFEYELIENMNLDIAIYGELVGIWYPENIYYLQIDGSPYTDDLRWRKGTWGLMGPGISAKIDNRYEIKVAFNYNSAGYLPSYFNYNYMHNRSIYYNTNNESLEFPLILEQIEMMNQYSISEDGEEFLIPKDIYPILSNTFNPFPTYGFTGEFAYSYNNKVNISFLGSVYIQSRENSGFGSYYSIDSKISLKDEVIRHVSFLDLYLSNIFFWGIEDNDKLIFGLDIGFKLTDRMNLICNLNQLYFDSNLNGTFNGSTNVGVDFGVTF